MVKVNPAVVFALLWAAALPLGLLIWWKRRTGAKLWCFLAGAVCFFLFAMVLEQMLHAVCITGENRISEAILASPVTFTLYGGLAAGLFEETARLFGFKLLLRNHRGKECAVAYGIGHGGCEVLILIGINYLMLLLAQLGVFSGSESTGETLRATADAITWAGAGTAMFERVSAMMLHIGLSMIMFAAAKQKGKLWLYPVAILLHALADTPAGLYQYQGSPSVLFVEIFALLGGLACLFLGKKVIDRYTNPEKGCDSAVQDSQ